MAGKTRCLTHDLWEGLSARIYDYLHSVTLADIRNKKPENRKQPSEFRMQDSGF